MQIPRLESADSTRSVGFPQAGICGKAFHSISSPTDVFQRHCASIKGDGSSQRSKNTGEEAGRDEPGASRAPAGQESRGRDSAIEGSGLASGDPTAAACPSTSELPQRRRGRVLTLERRLAGSLSSSGKEGSAEGTVSNLG
jgi:hypothetical protein